MKSAKQNKKRKKSIKGPLRSPRFTPDATITTGRHATKMFPKNLARVLRIGKMTIGELAASSPSALRTAMKEQGVALGGQTAERLIRQARRIYLNQRTDAVLDWLRSPTRV